MVDEENLSINGTQRSINLRSGTALRIERAGPLPGLWRGIRIHHRHPRYPARLAFIPSNGTTRELLEQLQKLGYWVSK